MQLREPPRVRAVRLFADAEGRSHLGEVRVDTSLSDFAPPAPPLYVSEPVDAKRSFFLVIPVGWVGKPHPAPGRQVMVLMSGSLEATTSDGGRLVMKQGDVALVEDTSGEGHSTKNTGDEPAVLAVTQY